VWFDAPIGYIGSFAACAPSTGLISTLLKPGAKTELYHFIGKDISYFHTLFWPAVLHGAGFASPRRVVHGFLTVNGQKMSKSRGTFITAPPLSGSICRRNTCAITSPPSSAGSVDDIDLNLEDFTRA
jgi:methionyl-tRNA synthetase